MADPDELPDLNNGIETPFERRMEPTVEPSVGVAVGNRKRKNDSDTVTEKLICTDCEEWYGHNEDWEMCPKCGHDAREGE